MDSLKRAEWLSGTVLVGVALVLIGLLVRVGWLLAHATPFEVAAVEKQTTGILKPMPATGAILDNASNPLAVSVRMFNLFADPAYISDVNRFGGKDVSATQKADMTDQARKNMAEALAPLFKDLKPEQIKFAPDEFEKYLEENATYAVKKSKDQLAAAGTETKLRRFLWVAKEVDEKFYNDFQALKKKYKEESKEAGRVHSKDPFVRAEAAEKSAVLFHTLDGVGFIRSVKRVYPMGEMLGQVIGFRNNFTGVEGLETQLEDLLKGREGKMSVVRDAARHTLWVDGQNYHPADDGRNVWLTIDSVMQDITEEELTQGCTEHGAESGCAIVMDPFTGRILSIANWPKFDPNKYTKYKAGASRDRAITDPYEPGSIFKPFVLGWAIDHGVVHRNDVFECHGGRFYDPTGRLVTDTHGYGALTAEEVLVKSSNVGMTQVGWRMGIPMLREGVRAFGFGQLTGVELPGDQKGLVKADNQWNKGTLTSVSFGYEVAATPLQLVRAYATFSNGGYLVTPRILHAVEDVPGKAVPWEEVAGPPIQKQIISEQTCEIMRDIMEGVLTKGTAKGAISSVYRLYGKTGTAHLAIRGAGHYAGDQYNSSFLAGGPVTDPKLVIVVTMHKPDPKFGHFGGVVAAPTATRILERSLLYMQVKPDQVMDAKKMVAKE